MLKLFCAGLVALALAGCNESRPQKESAIGQAERKLAELCATTRAKARAAVTPEGISAFAAALESCRS